MILHLLIHQQKNRNPLCQPRILQEYQQQSQPVTLQKIRPQILRIHQQLIRQLSQQKTRLVILRLLIHQQKNRNLLCQPRILLIRQQLNRLNRLSRQNRPSRQDRLSRQKIRQKPQQLNHHKIVMMMQKQILLNLKNRLYY